MSRNKQHKRDLKKFKAMMGIKPPERFIYSIADYLKQPSIADYLKQPSVTEQMFPCKKI